MREPDLSSIPDSWVWASIGDVAESMRNGVYKPASDYGPDGVVTLRMYNIEDGRLLLYNLKRVRLSESELEHFGLKGGDILINRVNSTELVGKACIIPEDAGPLSYESKNIRLRLASGAESQFVNEWLRTAHARQLLQYSCKQTTNMASVDQGTIASLPLPLPPSNEQRRIVAKIEALQERSRKARAALEAIPPLLEQFRQSVLAAAFRGDLTADWRAQHPDVEPASVLLDRIRADRRRRWEEAELSKMQAKGKMPKDEKWKERYKEPGVVDEGELPELPEGWCWADLGQAFEVAVGATPSRKEASFWGGEIPWVSSGEVAFCHIDSTKETITESGLANTSTEIYPPGTVLIGMIGEGKTRGQVAILDIPACNNQNSAAIKVSETPIAPEYVYRFLEMEYQNTRILGSGNNQPALNKSRVQAMRIPLMPLAEQRQAVMKIEESLAYQESLKKEVSEAHTQLATLDQSILAKAFRGELVPQDPNDEPASVLLERIRAEREAQSAKPRAKKKTPGSTKGTKKAPPVSVNENDDLPLFNNLQK